MQAHPSNQVATIPHQKQSPFAVMASRLDLDEQEIQNLMSNTLMKAKDHGQQVTNEELVTFLAVCNEYSLNPLTKEIYAFNNRGAIQPIVSIDGWLKIINGHPQFDGMEFVDNQDGGALISVTCKIYRKDRTRPTEVTEYMAECKDTSGKSEPWKRWPARMLRHKATIQAARYAFGLSGFVDPDEAERIKESMSSEEKDVTPKPQQIERSELPVYPEERFKSSFNGWALAVKKGQKTPEDIITMVSSKWSLTEDQKQTILSIPKGVAQ